MIKLTAVGDIFLGDYTLSLGYGIRSSIRKTGCDYHLFPIKSDISGADILFGNLETVISDVGIDEKNIKTLICRGEKNSVDILKKNGFNVVNIANNHILQHGIEAYHDSINVLRDNGIDVVGEKGDNRYSSKPIIKNIDGEKAGILGYSFVRENFQKDNIFYAMGHPDSVCKDIELLKTEVDYVIVSCHWGIEYINKPSFNIRRMARAMVDSGASLILGHHPHVVQGIEKYNKSLIFYSLGNFLFDFLWSRRTREAFIANISMHGNKIDYGIMPVRINNNYQIERMNISDSENFKCYMNQISSFENIDDLYAAEDEISEYYIEANNIFKRYQKYKLYYVLKNIYRTDRIFMKYILGKVFR